MLGSMANWVYDESPTEGLKFEGPLASLKQKIAESGSLVFQDLIKRLLLENTHRTSMELVPSKTLEEEQLKDEKDRLAAIKLGMSDADLERVIENTAELKRLQASEDSPEAKATIPSLQLDDLERKVTEYPIEINENENDTGVTVVRHELSSTSGIVYASFGVDLSGLPLDEVVLLPLFTRMLTETGAGEYDSVALSRRIGTYTGGVSTSLFNTPVLREGVDQSIVTDCSNMITKLVIKGKATSDRADELFSLFNLILTGAKLDSQNRVIEMLRESKARLEAQIPGSGHSYALQRLRARYTASAYVEEKMGGISYLESVKALLKQAEEDWPSLLARLEKIRSTILDCSKCRNGMFLDLTGDQKVLSTIQPAADKFLKGLPGDKTGSYPNFYKEEHPWVTQAKVAMAEKDPIADEGFVVPTQVSYVGKGGLIYNEGDKVSGSVNAVTKYLRTGYLWDRVRVMGGAYGAFCVLGMGSGFFGQVSYRDPNLAKTIDVYDATADALMEAADLFEKDSDALSTAIIGAVGDMDGALSPDQKGWKQFTRWITGESPEHRQQKRDELIDTKPDDFRDFAKRLKNMKNPSVAVVSSKSAFEAAAKEGKSMALADVV